MKAFVFLILLLFGLESFSQKLDSVQQFNILTRIDSMDFEMDFEMDFREVIDTCDKYLGYDFTVCSYEAGLLSSKAEALEYVLDSIQNSEVYYEKEEFYDSIADSLIYQIVELHQKAISSCRDCEFVHIKRKYIFEYSNGVINKQDFQLLKKQGYFGIEDYWAISPQYFSGNNNWIGFEVSANHLEHFFFDEEMISLQFLGMGFRKNVSTQKGGG